jgi:hypothetical protein
VTILSQSAPAPVAAQRRDVIAGAGLGILLGCASFLLFQ